MIGLWCNDDGCYGHPNANGIPDLSLTYLVECSWCAKRIGESPDAADAIRIAYEHSPYVNRDLYHRSRVAAENAVGQRQRATPRGRHTTFVEIVVDALPPRDDA